MKYTLKQSLMPMLALAIGFSILWFTKNVYAAGPLTPSGPPSPTGFSLDELATQIGAIKSDTVALQSALSAQGVKQVIRGTMTGTTANISPSVVPSKCVVTLRGIVTGLPHSTGFLGEMAIVTSLTSSQLTIQYTAASGTYMVAYEIVEFK